ncbi:MAG: VOC family protein [Actinobacteria bacterium]|nr:MAG: VOC family protein [Actinomycetota bacterium]
MPEQPATISYIELPATELKDTKSFYTAVFGWSWVDYGPNYAAFAGAGIDGGFNTEATPATPHESGAESSNGPFVLFAANDLGAMERKIRDAGGEIVSGPYAYPGGNRFHFRDPSGNILGVYKSG